MWLVTLAKCLGVLAIGNAAYVLKGLFYMKLPSNKDLPFLVVLNIAAVVYISYLVVTGRFR